MSNQISNNEEFEQNLKKLGDLYEEGKDKLLLILPKTPTNDEWEALYRLYDILKEMRDLAAVQMQHKHFLNEN